MCELSCHAPAPNDRALATGCGLSLGSLQQAQAHANVPPTWDCAMWWAPAQADAPTLSGPGAEGEPA